MKQADVLFGSKSQQEQCRNVHFDWQLLPFLPIFLGIEDFPTEGLSQGHTAEVAQCVRQVLLIQLVLRLQSPRSCDLPPLLYLGACRGTQFVAFKFVPGKGHAIHTDWFAQIAVQFFRITSMANHFNTSTYFVLPYSSVLDPRNVSS